MTVCVRVCVCTRARVQVHTRVRAASFSFITMRLIPFSSSFIHQRAGSAPLLGGVYFLATGNVQGSPAHLSRHLAHSLPRRLCDAMLILLPQMKMSSQLLQMPLTADPSLEEKTAVVQPLTSEAPSGTMAEEEFCRFPAGQGCPDRARQPE